MERAVRRWVGGLPLAVAGRRRPLTENTGARSDAALPKLSGRNSCFELRPQSSKNQINLPQSSPEMHSFKFGVSGDGRAGPSSKVPHDEPRQNFSFFFRIRVLIMTPTFDSERYLYSFLLQERLSYKNCCLACDVRRCQGCSVG